MTYVIFSKMSADGVLASLEERSACPGAGLKKGGVPAIAELE
jgi:hypothetical protein